MLAGTYGNFSCVRVENGEMKDDSRITAMDSKGVKYVITRLKIG